ncbi:hypothetical protein BCV70DRAFT_207565 [Testicularia cyperi]|uniref:Uncharacterized protein n=1 Tax=Testicularia cyperi TaxID=1882483 RepID=A0A317XKI4_9BASI|nr:hypothetical protein BCV70DRAFT_207565 [Testicularia cyperi]
MAKVQSLTQYVCVQLTATYSGMPDPFARCRSDGPLQLSVPVAVIQGQRSYRAVLCCAVLCCAVLCCAVLYRAVAGVRVQYAIADEELPTLATVYFLQLHLLPPTSDPHKLDSNRTQGAAD